MLGSNSSGSSHCAQEVRFRWEEYFAQLQTFLVQEAKIKSLKILEQNQVGSPCIFGYQLESVANNDNDNDNGLNDTVLFKMPANCAALDQDPNNSLEVFFESISLEKSVWGDFPKIYQLAKKFDLIIAIIDTRYPELEYQYHSFDETGVPKFSDSLLEIQFLINDNKEKPKPVIKLAYTGLYYLSVAKEPKDPKNASVSLSFPSSPSVSASSSSSWHPSLNFQDVSMNEVDVPGAKLEIPASHRKELLNSNDFSPYPDVQFEVNNTIKQFRDKIDEKIKNAIHRMVASNFPFTVDALQSEKLLSLMLSLFNQNVYIAALQKKMEGFYEKIAKNLMFDVRKNARLKKENFHHSIDWENELLNGIFRVLNESNLNQLSVFSFILTGSFILNVSRSAKHVAQESQKYASLYIQSSALLKNDSRVLQSIILMREQDIFRRIFEVGNVHITLRRMFGVLKKRVFIDYVTDDNPRDIFLKNLLENVVLTCLKDPKMLLVEILSDCRKPQMQSDICNLNRPIDEVVSESMHMEQVASSIMDHEPTSEEITDAFIRKIITMSRIKLQDYIKHLAVMTEKNIEKMKEILLAIQKEKKMTVVAPTGKNEPDKFEDNLIFFNSYIKKVLENSILLDNNMLPFELEGLTSIIFNHEKNVERSSVPFYNSIRLPETQSPLKNIKYSVKRGALLPTTRRASLSRPSEVPVLLPPVRRASLSRQNDLLGLFPPVEDLMKSYDIQDYQANSSSMPANGTANMPVRQAVYLARTAPFQVKREWCVGDPEVLAALWGKNFVFARMIIDGGAVFYSLDQWLHPYPMQREMAQPYLAGVELLGGLIGAFAARQAVLYPRMNKAIYGRLWDALSYVLMTHVYLTNFAVLLDRAINNSQTASDVKWIVELNGFQILLFFPHLIWRISSTAYIQSPKNGAIGVLLGFIQSLRQRCSPNLNLLIEGFLDTLLSAAIINLFATMCHMPRTLIYQIIPLVFSIFMTLLQSCLPGYKNRMMWANVSLATLAYLGTFVQNVIDPHLIDPNAESWLKPMPAIIWIHSGFLGSAFLYSLYLNSRYGIQYVKYYEDYPVLITGPATSDNDNGGDFHRLEEIEIKKLEVASEQKQGESEQERIDRENDWVAEFQAERSQTAKFLCFSFDRTKSVKDKKYLGATSNGGASSLDLENNDNDEIDRRPSKCNRCIIL